MSDFSDYIFDDFDFYDEDEVSDESKGKKKNKHKRFASNEDALIYLANTHKLKKSKGFKLKKYQKISMFIYDRSILDELLSKFKFKDVGNIYDYKEFEYNDINSYSGLLDYSLCNRIAISKKKNSLLMYTKDSYAIKCTFIISTKYMNQFSKISTDVMSEDDDNNSLKNENFSCAGKSYLELSDAKKDNTKQFDLVRKKILNENLIFDENSTLNKVKTDVAAFFTKKTEEMYAKLDISLKRGIILYGEPGNGKSSMIREIIRTVPDDITKVVIRRVSNMVNALSSLINALKDKKAIIIIEDIDSMLTSSNRSDFLNTIDGLDINSGLYIIATTNYPERLDSAIFNRAGRFDKAYKIGNPNKESRRLFFKSRNLPEILADYPFSKDKKKVSDEKLIKAFVKNSEDVPMATLKEIITSVTYKLIYNEEKYIIDSIEKTYNDIVSSNDEHDMSHRDYLETVNRRTPFDSSYGTVIPYPVKKAPKVGTSDDEDDVKVIKIKKLS